jgi:Arc/MetJ-type ribon-helix-helix transcriptional regulator
MAQKTSPIPAPLTFDLPTSLLNKIEAHRQKRGLKSTSEVIRLAVSQFNFADYESSAEEHHQISVRLPVPMKTALVKTAKKKRVSVGELLRVAIDALPLKPAATKPAVVKNSPKKAKK